MVTVHGADAAGQRLRDRQPHAGDAADPGDRRRRRLWLWTQGQVGVGAVAAATAMALRLNGISHWVMWEMASLFEHIGTVQDGINTLSRPHAVVDRADAVPLQVSARRDPLRARELRLRRRCRQAAGDRPPGPAHPRRARRSAWSAARAPARSTIVNLLLRFYDVEAGRMLIDGQDIAGVTQDSLRAQVGMVTQDTSLLHRSVRDNILYGRPDASDARWCAAAAARRGARLHPGPGRSEGPHRATTRTSASAASSCRAASASASRSPA